jgi:hypothetical protein
VSLSLATLRQQTQATIGDPGEIDITPDNLDLAVNWALVEAARLTGLTVAIRTIQVQAGGSTIQAAPALAVKGVVLL